MSMKKLLSVLLTLVLILGVSAVAFPAFTVKAADSFRLYAYRPDGGRDIATSEMPAGVTIDYDPSLLINGQHVYKVMLSPQFAEKYKAAYFEVPAGIGLLQIFVNGAFNLSAVKMTHDEKTFYAALATNVDLRLVPMSSDANLYLSGSFSGDTLDAPMSLLTYKTYATACSDKASGNRLTLRTYLDMRYCKSAAGYEVTSVGPNLTLENVTFTHKTRTAAEVNNESRISLSGSSIADLSINGTDGTDDSFCYKELKFLSDFCGLQYGAAYHGRIARYADHGAAKYISGSASNSTTVYTCGIGTADPASVGAMELPAEVREAVYANVAAALDRKLNYKLGEKLPGFIVNGPLCLELSWKDEKGKSCTGMPVAENTAYTARVYVSLVPTNDTPPVYYTFRPNSTVIKPELALSASLEEAAWYQIPAYSVKYPAIDPGSAPVITQQPEAQTYYTNSGTPVTYTLKAENAVSYQWHAVRTDSIDLTLADDDVYQGATTNTLRVKNPSGADMVKEFYCVVSSPIFPDVKSDRAALNRVSRVSSVTVNNLDAIEAGPYSGRDTTFTVSFDPPYGITRTQSVEYRDYETNGVPLVFTEGDKIKVTVTVEITQDGYEFQRDGAVGIWNDQMVPAVFPEAGNYRLATFTYTAVVGADENAILFADLKAKNPGIGASRSDFRFDIVASDPKFFVAGITVSPYTQYIDASTEYTVNFTLLANSGFYFTEGTRFSVDGEPLEATLRKSNTVADLVYKFTTPGMEIEMAEIFANVPKIGELLDPSINTVETTGAEKDRFAFSGTWDVERDKDNKVTGDYTRALNFTLNAKDGYRFTPSTIFVVHYKNNDGSDAALLLNNELTADADVVELLAFFDSYPPIHEHTPYNVYQIEGNDKQHEYSCKYCHERIKENHIPGDWIVDTPATATTDGSKHKECTKCHYVLETAVIPKTGGGTPAFTLGDVDGKDGITAADARLALRAAVGLEKYEAGTREFLAADVDLSGTLTAADARLILRKAVKLTDKEWGGGKA